MAGPVENTTTHNRLKTTAAIALFAAVLASRLAFLPNGPWEQDEVLLAAGVVDFDLSQHRPHPPGFPLWIATGRLFNVFVEDALVSLQVASSVASAITVVLLAALLRTFTSAGIATLAAIAYATLPLIWLHSHRAFATTPALMFAVVAVWLWHRPSGPTRLHLLPWLALAAATAVRPQLLPLYAAVAVLGVRGTTSPRNIAIGLATYTLVAGGLYAPVVLDSGGPMTVIRIAGEHLARHDKALQDSTPFESLGVVRALGGLPPALILLLLTFTGLTLPRVSRRRASLRPHVRWLWLGFMTTLVCILGFHHPGFPRYSPPLVLAAWPAIVLSVSSLPMAVQRFTWSAGALAGIVLSWSPLVAMQQHRLPVVEALHSLQFSSMRAISGDGATTPFIRWYIETNGYDYDLESKTFTLSDDRTHETVGLLSSNTRLAPGLTSSEETFDHYPRELDRYGQNRLEEAYLLHNPILASTGVHLAEINHRGEAYTWLSDRSELRFPTTPHKPARLVLQLLVPEDRGNQTVVASIAARRAHEDTLAVGITKFVIPTKGCPAPAPTCTVHLELPNAFAEDGGDRLLSAQLIAAWLESPAHYPVAHQWSPGQPTSMAANGVQIEGVYPPEHLLGNRMWGAWLAGHSVVDTPMKNGLLELKMARPSHLKGPVIFRSGATTIKANIDNLPTTVRVPVGGEDGRVTITSPSFRPAEKTNSSDTRDLGLILLNGRFIPNITPTYPEGP